MLQVQLDAAEWLREAAERNAAGLRTALRMLEAPKPATETGQHEPKRRRWQRSNQNP